MNRLGFGCAIGLVSLPFSLSAEPSRVTLEQTDDGAWRLRRNDETYSVRGAGGYDRLELLRELGGNTVRTWGVEQLESPESGEPLLDRAARLGLCVMVGLWVNHPRHGHDYGDEAMLQTQRDRIRAAVRKYRDHPAVLMWGLGNEMEGDGRDPRVWRELEVLARIIKAEDPDHPVCTVLAGTGHDKVRSMQAHYTSLDLLGINIYGGAEHIDDSLAQQGWNRPYLVTEFGPDGHWESPATEWGAPLEPSSAEKAAAYLRNHGAVMQAPRGLCLGTFCFLWGQKQETTATWFSMFLPTGEKTPSVDAMARAWTGAEPRRRSPLIHAVEADFCETSIAPESLHHLTANVVVPDGGTPSFQWLVLAETNDRKFGGDPENAPPAIPDRIVESQGARAVLRAPAVPGAYRVFLYVRDGHGGGAAGNFPFYVK